MNLLDESDDSGLGSDVDVDDVIADKPRKSADDDKAKAKEKAKDSDSQSESSADESSDGESSSGSGSGSESGSDSSGSESAEEPAPPQEASIPRWKQIWTINEMKTDANKWTLSGDAGVCVDGDDTVIRYRRYA